MTIRRRISLARQATSFVAALLLEIGFGTASAQRSPAGGQALRRAVDT